MNFDVVLRLEKDGPNRFRVLRRVRRATYACLLNSAHIVERNRLSSLDDALGGICVKVRIANEKLIG